MFYPMGKSSIYDKQLIKQKNKTLEKLANTAWQTLLFVSELLAMVKVTPDLKRKQ